MFPAHQFIALEGPAKRIAVYDSGDNGKPVLFFVHGLAINGRVWKNAFGLLQEKFRCIAIDLPGHGHSWNERGDFSMSFYAQVVRNCIETMKLRDVTLIGHSMGGQISVIVALQLPSVVTKLALVCAAGIETFTEEEKQKNAQGASFFYGVKYEAQKVISFFNARLGTEQMNELVQEFITQQAERFSLFSEAMVASVNGMLNEPVYSFLPQISQPVLVLYGENDQLIPNKWLHPSMTIRDIVATAEQQIPRCEAKLVGNCGHYLPVEQPEVLAESLIRFSKN